EIGHSHRRAVLIMYFWSALIAFGVVGLSLLSAAAWVLTALAVLMAIGVALLRGPLRAVPVGGSDLDT
ncbi:MAG: undecaprenyl/decaprenyl-phosphate alpha-N-acetylglucosaminyl 1-phosphate transferase, partial [Sporichthyaceae bacterium]